MTLKTVTAERVDMPRASNGRTLPQMLRDTARERPDTIAIRSKKAGLWHGSTWRDLFDKVGRVAAYLESEGLNAGEVICLISENREEAWITQMAAMSLGAISVNVYPDTSEEEVDYVLTHSGAVFALGEDQEQIDKILSLPGGAPALRRILYVEPRGLWSYSDERLQRLRIKHLDAPQPGWLEGRMDGAKQSDIAVYCYTSGTTGRPKAVMLGHDFILDNAYRFYASMGLQDGGYYFSYISPAWAIEQFFGTGLMLLAPLVLHFAEKPETVQADMREIGPEFLMFTPRQWEMQASDVDARMLDAPAWRQRLLAWGLRQGRNRAVGQGSLFRRLVLFPLADQLVLKGIRDYLGLTRAKAVFSGGSGLSAELFNRYRAVGVPLCNLYGVSELGIMTAHRPDDRNPETLGRPLPSDPTITAPLSLEVDPDGRLKMKGLACAGFLNNPEATEGLGSRDTGFDTGDAVRIDDNGELIFLDRAKDMRRLSTGQAYPPQFLENHLRSTPMIRDAVVFGDEAHDRVVALVSIDMEIAGRFAERAGLAFGTYTELSQLPEVRARIADSVEQINQLLDPGSRISGFANFPKELDADEDELTRSRKVRRNVVEVKYAALIEALYANAETAQLEVEVSYQDGRKSKLRAEVAINRMEAAT